MPLSIYHITLINQVAQLRVNPALAAQPSILPLTSSIASVRVKYSRICTAPINKVSEHDDSLPVNHPPATRHGRRLIVAIHFPLLDSLLFYETNVLPTNRIAERITLFLAYHAEY